MEALGQPSTGSGAVEAHPTLEYKTIKGDKTYVKASAPLGVPIYIWTRAAIPPAPPLHSLYYYKINMKRRICTGTRTHQVYDSLDSSVY